MPIALEQAIDRAVGVAPRRTTWGIAVLGPEGNIIAGRHAHRTFEAFSLNKLVVAEAVAVTALDPTTEIVLQPNDRRGGNGVLQYTQPGNTAVSLQTATELMLRISDNTATRAVVRTLGGPKAVNDALRQSPVAPALQTTRLLPVDPHNKDPDALYEFGHTTPYETATLLGQVTQDPVHCLALRKSNFTYGLRWKIDPRQQPAPHLLETLITQGKRGNVVTQEELDAALAADWQPGLYPNKEGTFRDSRHDVAVIGNLGVAALSEGYPHRFPEGPLHPAHQVHEAIGIAAVELLTAITNE